MIVFGLLHRNNLKTTERNRNRVFKNNIGGIARKDLEQFKISQTETKGTKTMHDVIKYGATFLAAHYEVSKDYTDLLGSPTLALTPTQTLSVV